MVTYLTCLCFSLSPTGSLLKSMSLRDQANETHYHTSPDSTLRRYREYDNGILGNSPERGQPVEGKTPCRFCKGLFYDDMATQHEVCISLSF